MLNNVGGRNLGWPHHRGGLQDAFVYFTSKKTKKHMVKHRQHTLQKIIKHNNTIHQKHVKLVKQSGTILKK
jgi:hypothetical protein